MTDTNHGTTLLCLTAVLPLADLETLKARIAGWSDAERQTAIDWAVARLTGAVEPEVPTHVAPFLAVRESTSACQCPACSLALTARRMVDTDPAMAAAGYAAGSQVEIRDGVGGGAVGLIGKG